MGMLENEQNAVDAGASALDENFKSWFLVAETEDDEIVYGYSSRHCISNLCEEALRSIEHQRHARRQRNRGADHVEPPADDQSEE